MAPLKPMLGDLELQQVQRIETEGDQLLVPHRVPGLEGDFLQGLGRRGSRIALTGVLSGAASRDALKTLREKFKAAEPVPFVSDIATATKVDQVLIEEMEVRDLAGKPERYEYTFVLREHTPPPAEPTEPPPPTPIPPVPDDDTGTLIVEVIVEGEPGFDFSRVTVTAEGTQDDGTTLSRTLTDRADNVWTERQVPPGRYTAKAVVTDPPQMSGAADAAVRAGETTKVTITLRRNGSIAKAFLVHFWFDNAFVEPCMKEVLAQVAKYAGDHPQEKLLVVGHCDKTGSDVYNQSLSERRARSVFACLTFGRDQGAALAEWNELRRQAPGGLPDLRDSWGTREVQLMLQELRYYPGAIDGENGPMTQRGVRTFQGDRNLPPTGAMDEATWNALITAYLGEDPLSVSADRFFPNCDGEILKWLGCGEEDPVRNTEDAWRPNRRVELLFVRADRIPCPVAQPDTFNLPAPGAVAAGWCLGSAAQHRCCFLTRTPGQEGPSRWLVTSAEPGTVIVRGSIVHEDGTPAAGAHYVLIAPDGQNMDGERPAGPTRGRPILGRTAADGTFAYPDKPKGIGRYILEILEPFAVRAASDPPVAAKGSIVCKRLDGSSPFDVVLTERPDVTSRVEVRVFTEDAGAAPSIPLSSAWVYWREAGNPALLRTDATGLLFARHDGADRTLPEEYTNRFTTALSTRLGLYFSRGAKPIPDALLDAEPALFTDVVVEPLTSAALGAPMGLQADAAAPDGGQTPPAQATLPNRSVLLTRPAELSLWPLLWQPPIDAYAIDGLSQGAALWTNPAGSGNLTVTEGNASAAPSAAVRPQERGLKIEGTIDAQATGVTIQILGANAAPLSLKTTFTGTPATQISATLGVAAGTLKPFEAVVIFTNAAAALGPVDISIQSVGMTPPVLATFAVHLVGCQIALVEDAFASPAARGSLPGEAQEVILVDFLGSPQPTVQAISGQTRARRMIPFDIQFSPRLLDPAAVAGPTNPQVVKPRMPMWMQELHLIGLSRAQLESLFARKYVAQHGVQPGQHVDFALDLQWRLTLAWDGPDSGNPDGYTHSDPFPFAETVQLHFGRQGQLLDSTGANLQVGANGEIPGAVNPAPAAATFPVTGRRRPVVAVGLQRPWGRQAGAPMKDAVLIELQPLLVDTNGREIMRGGDGSLELTSLTLGGQRIHRGLVPDATGAPQDPAAAVADALLPPFRVRGLNPAMTEINTLIDALVTEFFNGHATAAAVGMLSLTRWQNTVRSIVAHESATVQGHFDRRGNGAARRGFGGQRFGHEFGLPAFGAPHGYGLGQLDTISIPPLPAGQPSRHCNPDEVWSFLENLRSAVTVVMQEKAQIARNAFLGASAVAVAAFNALPQRRREAMFRREVVRRYNGGREFRFEGNQWVIHTTTNDTVLRSYPNQVLGTQINYPDQRDFPDAQFGGGF
jgi:outer membrane protein OmpA-like peptidoglycan-associated protein